jgi:hypothetical protein
MNGNIFARLTGTKRNLLALLASSAMLTAGCANMANTASGVNALDTSANLSGRVHGGNQPVSGATVNLYFAAQSEYAAPTLVATTTTAADGSGSFSFVSNSSSTNSGADNTFHCNSSGGSPLVYVVAKGGNTINNGDSTVNNSAAAFIAVYGTCDQLQNSPGFVDMTEVTTVATMAAVQQFFDPSNEGISADGTGQQYNVILNLPKTIALMVDAASGTAVSSTVIPASVAGGNNGVVGVTVTATPETSKINTLANVLSACVNNASASAAPCTTLLTDAVPATPSVTNKPNGTVFAPATDVVQAAYYILTNPTNGGSSNLASIYGLAPAAGAPYQPALSAQPTDWTIAINYSSSSSCGTGHGGFINQPYDIGIDSSDNIWISNSQSSSGNLSELSASGAAATCVFLGSGSNGGLVLDNQGSVWVTSTGSNNIYRYSSGLGSLSQGIVDFPTPYPSLAVTADGLGNVYFSTASSGGALYQIPGAAASASAITPIQISTIVGSNPVRLFPDFNGLVAKLPTPSNIWVTSGAGYVARVTPSTNSGDPSYENNFSTTTFAMGVDSYGLAITAANNVFVSSGSTDNFITYLQGGGTSYSPSWTTSAGFAGLNNPTGIAIDGKNNVWVPNNTNTSGSVGSVSEISSSAAALSSAPTGFQKSSTFLSSGLASIVDQAGNVWVVGNNGTTNYVTEIVGAGVPIYQPFATGLTNGRFQTIP